MLLSVLTMVVGVLLGIGGAQELYIRGVLGGEAQPFGIGLLGIVTSLLLVASGAAMAAGWRHARPLVLTAAALNLVFVAYSALPPHRNVGMLALVLGAGFSLVLLARFGRGPVPAGA